MISSAPPLPLLYVCVSMCVYVCDIANAINSPCHFPGH